MDYQEIVNSIHTEVSNFDQTGKVANYIPALARIDSEKFGFCVETVKGAVYHSGDAFEKFSIQSISKVFTLTLALQEFGEDLWKRVNREPSGNAFNSLVQLETENGIPRNPFINAGALVVTDHVLSACGGVNSAKSLILDFVHSACCSKEVTYDAEVAESELEAGFRNAALANFLKSYGRLDNDIDSVLEVYFHQCSLAMSCSDLCKISLFLANGGVSTLNNQPIVSLSQAKRINALMLTCGLYDAVGDFAYRVGLPAKSGVGGGIIAIVPGEMSLAVWSPSLNASGNSIKGTEALKQFTDTTGCSIF